MSIYSRGVIRNALKLSKNIKQYEILKSVTKNVKVETLTKVNLLKKTTLICQIRLDLLVTDRLE